MNLLRHTNLQYVSRHQHRVTFFSADVSLSLPLTVAQHLAQPAL
jgi:hypothetical protein